MRAGLLVHLDDAFLAAVLAGPHLASEAISVVEPCVTLKDLDFFALAEQRTICSYHALH